MWNLVQPQLGGIASTVQAQTTPQDFITALLGKLTPEQAQQIVLAQAMRRGADPAPPEQVKQMYEMGIHPNQAPGGAPVVPAAVAPPGGKDDAMTIEWKKRNAARQQAEFEALRRKLEGR